MKERCGQVNNSQNRSWIILCGIFYESCCTTGGEPALTILLFIVDIVCVLFNSSCDILYAIFVITCRVRSTYYRRTVNYAREITVYSSSQNNGSQAVAYDPHVARGLLSWDSLYLLYVLEEYWLFKCLTQYFICYTLLLLDIIHCLR
jgi:hypothetical protein